jgi:hypothetical protein
MHALSLHLHSAKQQQLLGSWDRSMGVTRASERGNKWHGCLWLTRMIDLDRRLSPTVWSVVVASGRWEINGLIWWAHSLNHCEIDRNVHRRLSSSELSLLVVGSLFFRIKIEYICLNSIELIWFGVYYTPVLVHSFMVQLPKLRTR